VNVLLLGSKGYLGSYLSARFAFDTAPEWNVKYDWVINCIAKTSVEYCQEHPYESLYSNGLIIHDIHNQHPRAKILNFSSYYVYNDTDLCKETSKVTYDFNYARDKLMSEVLTAEYGGLTLRLGKLFGHPGTYKQQRLTEHVILSDDITVDNVLFNPTSVNSVGNLIIFLMYSQEGQNLTGVYNFSNGGTCTHAQWAMLINDIMGTNKCINVVDKIDKSFSSYGNFAMDISKIQAVYPSINNLDYDLLVYLERLKLCQKTK
jgi:dTDP-4-dehydrorhamnose reductase